MKIAVRYFTRSGNTQKIAEAIGAAVGVPALPLTNALEVPVDLLFLGSAVYAFGIDDAVKNFIGGLTPEQVSKVAIFSTTAVVTSAYNQLKKLLDERGIPVVAQNFHCYGKFAITHIGRPNQKDCDNAAAFAKELTQ
ncbi:MAG: flavodoxin [Clostridiales Family XIII bacterium]|jgi:flavodoxin|nr:flavodoxin [Clostridiales Family XIII bacterium]